MEGAGGTWLGGDSDEDGAGLTSSHSLDVAPPVKSPRKSRRTMDLLYQARGKARISVSLLMSYLKWAAPISTIAGNDGSL